MELHPRYRWDCAEFFADPDHTERMQLNGPGSAIDAIGRAAAQAGRTWNDQFNYILGICLGEHPPDFADGRSVEDWRTLLSPCRFRFSETEDWHSCMRLRTITRQRSGSTLC